MSDPPSDILLLGDRALRRVSRRVEDVDATAFRVDVAHLHAVLGAFRHAHGFGRAVSAPQIGIAQRFIALNLGNGPITMINPRITWRSTDRFSLWDDCMSFPDLLVRVERAASIDVCWHDLEGDAQRWERLDRATSELLQHEVDHLDGILAVDRAQDRDAIVLREVFDANRPAFEAMVDQPA